MSDERPDERVCRECGESLDDAVPEGGACPHCGTPDADRAEADPAAGARSLRPEVLNPPLMTPRAPLPPGAFIRMGPYAPRPRSSSSPPRWAEDPGGRNQWRWWDGYRWTDHVANDGTATTDPM